MPANCILSIGWRSVCKPTLCRCNGYPSIVHEDTRMVWWRWRSWCVSSWEMPSSGMWRLVAVVVTTSSACYSCYLQLMFIVRWLFSPWRLWRYIPPKRRFLQEPHCVTSQKTALFNVINIYSIDGGHTLLRNVGSNNPHCAIPQKTAFFIVAAVKTSNFTYLLRSGTSLHQRGLASRSVITRLAELNWLYSKAYIYIVTYTVYVCAVVWLITIRGFGLVTGFIRYGDL
jgi:hypothetical protein